MEFQVDAREGQFSVHLGTKTCSCRKWQLTGLPCAHVCAALAKNRSVIEDVVDPAYAVDTFKKIYVNIIHLLRGMDQWQETGHELIMPPAIGAPRPGRPKKKRRRGLDEKAATGVRVQERMRRTGMVMHCKRCGAAGHNRRKCPATGEGSTSQAATAREGSTSQAAM